MPAALVAFVEETIPPINSSSPRGPRFSILVATRSLRLNAGPRLDDVDTIGAFRVIEMLRTRLDGYLVVPGRRMVPLSVKFIDADDRVAIYELLYRFESIAPAPSLDATEIGGGIASTTRSLTQPVEVAALRFTKAGDVYEVRDAPADEMPDPATTLIWQGELRAEDLGTIESAYASIQDLIDDETVGELVEGDGPRWQSMKAVELRRLTPPWRTPDFGEYVQPIEAIFEYSP